LRPSAERTYEFTIEDDGPGIPRESRRAVLEPFVRLDPSRNYDTGGTGLGLAIAVNLARAMNGTLVLEDSALGGLCARLVLPCEPATGCGGGHGSL
jgi:two-component system osmolarity sensor histidine kinase EnvZ